MRKPSVEEAVSELVAKLNPSYGIEKTYLFGSSARGTRLEDSDVDVILVAKGFEGLSIPERQGVVQKAWSGEEDLHALAYTETEFGEIRQRATMKEILSYALEMSPKRISICPRCGKRGSRQVKVVKNSSGKSYRYRYFAHHKNGKVSWCYLG